SSAHRVVLRLRVMHDDGGRALLGNKLECAGQLHAELAFCRENPEQLRVILEVWTRTVAPRVAFALAGRNAEIMTQLAMHPFGNGFGGFHRESVQVERFGVLVRVLKRLETLRRNIADRHDLEPDDIDVRRVDRAEVVRDAETLARFLTGEMESCQLARRSVFRVRLGFVDDKIVSVCLGREETVDGTR